MARFLPALLVALTAAWCGTFYGGATAAGSTAALVVLLGVLFLVGSPWQDPLRLGGIGSPLPLALWAVVAISQWASPFPRAGRMAIVLLPALFWLPGAVERCWRWERGRRQGIRAVSAAVAGVAAWALVDAALHGGRAALPLGHHNLLAAWMVMLLPLAALPAREPGAWRWLGWGSGILAFAAVLASRSWLGGLALAAEGAAVLLVFARAAWRQPGQRRWLVLAGLMLAALLASQAPRAARIVSGEDPSARARGVYYEAAWDGFRARPLQGWGPGTAAWTIAAFLRPRPGVNPWGEAVGELHSLPLHLLYETGGAGLLLALLTVVLFFAERLADRSRARDRPLLAAGLLGLGGAAVVSLGSAAVAVLALPVAAAVAAGAALAALPEPKPELSFPVRAYAVLALLALFPLELARWRYDTAVAAAEAGRPSEARELLEQAAELDPEHPLYRFRLALVEPDGGPAEAARIARQAAADAGAVPPFWLTAGLLGRSAGEPWAPGALEAACALDPLDALPPWFLLTFPETTAGPDQRAAHHGAHALLAEPRLLAATFWEARPDLLPPVLEEVRRWPGVDAGWKEELLRSAAALENQQTGRRGEAASLRLEIDTVPARALSLHTFRRRPWPTLWPLVEVRGSAAERITLPAATTLPLTSRQALDALGCRTEGVLPSTLVTR